MRLLPSRTAVMASLTAIAILALLNRAPAVRDTIANRGPRNLIPTGASA